MNDELREKLQSWRVDPRIPDNFQREVWKRIAARKAVSTDSILLTWIQRLFSPGVVLSTSRIAFAAVTLGVGVGVTAGVVHTTFWNAATWNRLENQYVQSIDPYQRVSL